MPNYKARFDSDVKEYTDMMEMIGKKVTKIAKSQKIRAKDVLKQLVMDIVDEM